jgi:LmbE family N-acetylglucosaminyl deacetylase
MQNILILSPHTDDAELGAGGTIVRLLEEGKKLLWIVFSTAEESLPNGFPSDSLVLEFKEVMTKIGLNQDNFKIHNFKVRYLSYNRQDLLEELVKIRNNFKPESLLQNSEKKGIFT